MQVGIGMALVRGAGALISYLLRDEFITDRAAGAVNGTAAEPGPGTRRVTDGNNKLSIANGVLSFATGGVGGDNPGLWYNLFTRTAGRVLIIEITQGVTQNLAVGWGNTDLVRSIDGFRLSSSGIAVARNDTGPLVASTPVGVSYPLCVIMRAVGHIYLARISGSWKLVYVSNIHSHNDYPSIDVINGTTTIATSNYIRIPTNLWLPTPLCSDGFATSFATTDGLGHAEGVAGGIGAGGSGLTWTGATWSVSGAKAINTPGLGSDTIVNGDFAVDANWTKGTNWTIAGGVAVAAGVSATFLSQSGAFPTANMWYQVTWTIASRSSGSARVYIGSAQTSAPQRSTVATFIETQRRGSDTTIYFTSGDGFNGTIDNVIVKQLTLADLFSSVSVSTADVVVDVNVVVTSGTQAGLVLNLDSTSSPANFVIAYHDGTNAKLEKCVAGVYTTVIIAAATYSAGATLRVTKIGTAYRLYYNNALVGSGTISDAGIISNTRHGLFSTYEANTLDNFVVYASGSGGEYAALDQY